jgi:hypothetical protein
LGKCSPSFGLHEVGGKLLTQSSDIVFVNRSRKIRVGGRVVFGLAVLRIGILLVVLGVGRVVLQLLLELKLLLM